MFVRNGEKLGSVVADPSDAEPRRSPRKPAKPELTETGQEADVNAALSRVETVEPTPEPEKTPEPVRPKKASFKSALDKG